MLSISIAVFSASWSFSLFLLLPKDTNALVTLIAFANSMCDSLLGSNALAGDNVSLVYYESLILISQME